MFGEMFMWTFILRNSRSIPNHQAGMGHVYHTIHNIMCGKPQRKQQSTTWHFCQAAFRFPVTCCKGGERKRAEGASTDFAPTLINQYGVWACPPQTVLDRRTCISVRPRLDSCCFAYICCPEKTSTTYH